MVAGHTQKMHLYGHPAAAPHLGVRKHLPLGTRIHVTLGNHRIVIWKWRIVHLLLGQQIEINQAGSTVNHFHAAFSYSPRMQA